MKLETDKNSNGIIDVSTTHPLFPHLPVLRTLTQTPDAVLDNLKHRRMDSVNINDIMELHKSYSHLEFTLGNLRRERNENSDQMKKTMKELGKSAKEDPKVQELIQKGKTLKDRINDLEKEYDQVAFDIYHQVRYLPNTTHPSTPMGDESQATLLKTIGKPRTQCGNSPLKNHMEIGSDIHDWIDCERAGKTSGSSSYFLKNAAALLELGLMRYAMDVCVARGFVPVTTPDLIRYDVVDKCGFRPRSKDPQTYFVTHHPFPGTEQEHQLCLAATAEFPLAGMYAHETFEPKKLPIKMVGFGHAFRAEGLAGATNRGLYRVHQFTKVEMFSLCLPQNSESILQEFLDIQEEIYSGLELCFRVLNMPTQELGAPAHQKVDMEAWMPGRRSWGEISSTSNCTDYQARRLNIRYLTKDPSQAPMDYIHTVNGTAAAIPRLIVALLETHQDSTGDRIHIPHKLRPYILGKDVNEFVKGESLGSLVKRSLDKRDSKLK